MTSGRRVKLTFVVIAAALATLPLSSWASQNHQQSFKANLTIHAKGGFFDGHVGTAHVCQAGRTVTVVLNGGGPVGTVITDHSGQWGGVLIPGPGTYHATVTEEMRGGYPGVDCLGGTSLNSVTV